MRSVSSLTLLALGITGLAAPSRGEPAQRADEGWWSLQALDESIEVPPAAEVDGEAWARNAIDRFILRRLREQGLEPSPPAGPRALVRRLHVDLLGLPPDPDAVRRFEADPSDAAYEKLVDELLASPHYGERWARHWLDVVRYGESDGFERNKPRDNAWHYRDWVIKALNDDRPYDEFARMQIAGDITHAGLDGWAATGFLVAGVHNTVIGKSREMQLLARQDELEEIVGAVGQTFLGLTVNCARCHDHKFDPISTREYYRMISAIDGVRHGNREVHIDDNARRIAELGQRITELDAAWRDIDSAARETIRAERKARPDADPAPSLPEALAVWSFEENYSDDSGALSASPSGIPRVEGSALVLNGNSFIKTRPIGRELRAKTMVATVVLDNLDQRGGAAMTVTSGEGAFDAIVFGEKDPKQWLAGSEGFKRTQSFGGPEEATASAQPVQVAITYAEDGTISAYRDGQVYGTPYKKELRSYPAGEGYVLFGLRHEPPGGNRFLKGQVLEARLFDRALSPDEVAALAGVTSDFVSEQDITAFLDPDRRAERERLRSEARASREQRDQLASGQKRTVYAVDPGDAGVMRVHVRGGVKEFGEEVSPGGIAALRGVDAEFALAKNSSDRDRRRALAEWIASPDNPLLARVMVNRVWHHHFGQGLVKTPSDLGYSGGHPSHPQLLDWLAVKFRDGGFRLKALHREMVLSASYRQSSRKRPDAFEKDADNRWLWRYAPRRVEAEVLRDSVLSAAGVLDPRIGGPGFKDFTMKEEGTAFYFPIDKEDPAFNRRAVYRFSPRADRSSLLDTFDCPDPASATPARSVTTTPLAALSLMNNAFIVRMSGHFARRIETEAGDDPGAQVRRAWEIAFCRAPDAGEERAARKLVTEHGLTSLCRALWNSNEWVFIE